MVTREAELMRELHEQHASAVWAYVLRLTNGDRARAEDIVQQPLLRAWRHPEVLDQPTDAARGWLITVARRITIDDWRARTRRPEVVRPLLPEPDPVDTTDDVLQSWLVGEALGRLSPT